MTRVRFDGGTVHGDPEAIAALFRAVEQAGHEVVFHGTIVSDHDPQVEPPVEGHIANLNPSPEVEG